MFKLFMVLSITPILIEKKTNHKQKQLNTIELFHYLIHTVAIDKFLCCRFIPKYSIRDFNTNKNKKRRKKAKNQ